MNVIDIPQKASRSDYDEALTRYADLVKSRAIAVYRVGNVRYPGLSDIDLLVVTDRCGIDNQYFFSAMQRMPRRYLPLFLHEPFILPAWSLRVMRYTTHHAPALLAGRDVLHRFLPADEPDERWCRLLEGYCTYASFDARARQSGTLKGRMTIAVASAFRFQIADARALLDCEDLAGYPDEMDALRAGFFERQKPEDAVLDAWEQFAGAFAVLDERLRARLGVAKSQDLSEAARKLLRGEAPTTLFDGEYAFRRAQAIDGYHHDLAAMGFPYGHLFFIAAHPGAVRAASQPSLMNGMVRNLYRVRRRLEEYAGA